MTNELETRSQAKTSELFLDLSKRYRIEPGTMLNTLKATVIKAKDRQATNEEVISFCLVANQYGLNPFTREIHAFTSERGGGIVPIVGIDGWVKLVNREPGFDGCDFEDVFDAEGRIIGMVCTMYVKGRNHPVRVTEFLSECRRNTVPWNTMPHRMLRHKAYIQAARLCFGLSGIYDEDEACDIIRNEAAPTQANGKGHAKAQQLKEQLRQASQPQPQPAPASPEALDEISMLADRIGYTAERWAALLAPYGGSAGSLTADQAGELLAKMRADGDAMTPAESGSGELFEPPASDGPYREPEPTKGRRK